MALPSQLVLNGYGYDTIRGTVTEQRGTGLIFSLPRRWTATLDITSQGHLDNLTYCFLGIPVPLRLPDNTNVAKVSVSPSGDVPAVIPWPRRKPLQIDVTIEEIL